MPRFERFNSVTSLRKACNAVITAFGDVSMSVATLPPLSTEASTTLSFIREPSSHRSASTSRVPRLRDGSWGDGHATAQDAALNKSPVGLMSVAFHGSSTVSSRVLVLRAWSINQQLRHSRRWAFESFAHEHCKDRKDRKDQRPQRPQRPSFWYYMYYGMYC